MGPRKARRGHREVGEKKKNASPLASRSEFSPRSNSKRARSPSMQKRPEDKRNDTRDERRGGTAGDQELKVATFTTEQGKSRHFLARKKKKRRDRVEGGGTR